MNETLFLDVHISGVHGSNIDMKKTIIFSKSDVENENKGKPPIKGITPTCITFYR